MLLSAARFPSARHGRRRGIALDRRSRGAARPGIALDMVNPSWSLNQDDKQKPQGCDRGGDRRAARRVLFLTVIHDGLPFRNGLLIAWLQGLDGVLGRGPRWIDGVARNRDVRRVGAGCLVDHYARLGQRVQHDVKGRPLCRLREGRCSEGQCIETAGKTGFIATSIRRGRPKKTPTPRPSFPRHTVRRFRCSRAARSARHKWITAGSAVGRTGGQGIRGRP
jgi:hypothetical protein